MAKKFKKKISNSPVVESVVDIDKPEKFKIETEPTAEEQINHRIRRRINWAIVIFISLLSIAIGLALWVWWYSSQFEQGAGCSSMEVVKSVERGFSTVPFSTKGTVTLVLLGLDKVDNRTSPALTDTMIMIVIHKDGRIQTISIPRDLWFDPLETKVNALYTMGELNRVGQGSELVKTTLTSITGLPIDYVATVSIKTVERVVDVLGGIEIEVPRSFTDTMYPKEDVDLTSTDPAVLYETITFTAGKNQFDGKTVVKYMRSRHSTDPLEGNDISRTQRQQMVINKLAQQITNWQLILNPEKMGQLYGVWKSTVETDLTNEVIVAIVKQLATQKISMESVQIPVSNETEVGLLRVNPKNRYNQWVFEPVDDSFNALKSYLNQKIK